MYEQRHLRSFETEEKEAKVVGIPSSIYFKKSCYLSKYTTIIDNSRVPAQLEEESDRIEEI